MMSTYAAAVLTTVFVAGLSVVSIGDSKRPSITAVDGSALLRAHQFAVHKGEADHPASEGTGSFEVGMGPFYQSGRVRSFVVNSTDAIQQVTFMRASDSQEAQRILRGLRLDQETQAVIQTERQGNPGTGVSDRNQSNHGSAENAGSEIVVVPSIGVQIPEGAVVLVTTR